ncbi:hypothetical protein LIER_05396 [Lithospermum erythrorhizon]|uniref:Uncharacterized protein n=1 Tax=Lithospermum erythrorhizon TaxID=34254 RepID=A0AAV3P1R3_LITER
MAGLLQGLTGTIVTTVMQQLREQLPQLRGENPVEISSVKEDGEKTYTHTPPVWRETEPLAGQLSCQNTAGREAVEPAPPIDAMVALWRQVDALSSRVEGHVRCGTNMELAYLAPFAP